MLYQAMPHSRRIVVVRDSEVSGFRVPNGFQSDGASIPRFLWPFIGSPFAPEMIHAAVCHDYLYSRGIVSRRVADLALYRMLVADGVGKLRARVIWIGVRLFGWAFYD